MLENGVNIKVLQTLTDHAVVMVSTGLFICFSTYVPVYIESNAGCG